MIVLSKRELGKIREELEDAKKRLVNITSQKGEAAEIGGNAWHDNFTFEELVRKENETMAEITKLKKMINDAQTPEGSNDKIVGVGSFVFIKIGDKKAEWFELVGYGQSDPNSKKISHNSPIGAAILGKKIGESGEFVVREKRVQVSVLDIRSGEDL